MEEDRVRLMQELKDASLSSREREDKEGRLKTIESILKMTSEVKEQSEEMKEQMRPMKRQMAEQFVRAWKINKVLYKKYGGRVIFQQAGVEPLDAYREFLKEQEKNGSFQIIDKQYEPGFWRYFTNDAMHTFYSGEDGEKFINTPWWMMEEPPKMEDAFRRCLKAAASSPGGVSRLTFWRSGLSANWEELLAQANLNLKEPAKIETYSLFGYSWIKPVPWESK